MVSRQQEEHHSSQRDNKFFFTKELRLRMIREKPDFIKFFKEKLWLQEVVESCQMCWISNGMQQVCNTNIRVTTSGETNKNALQMVFISFAKLFLVYSAPARDEQECLHSANLPLVGEFV